MNRRAREGAIIIIWVVWKWVIGTIVRVRRIRTVHVWWLMAGRGGSLGVLRRLGRWRSGSLWSG